MPIPWLAMGLGALGSAAGSLLQGGINRSNASYQNAKNMQLLKYQLNWDSPVNQMARFKEAGLNPNLIYGQGSPGNMNSAPKYPDIQPVQVQGRAADLGIKIQQLKLMEAQTNLTEQKTSESGVKQDVMRAQQDLIKANPLMRPEYVNSIVSQLQSAADIKRQERDVLTMYMSDDNYTFSIGQRKIMQELQLLEQRFKLGTADQAIKAEVLNSKEFQNAILEIQKKWLSDGEITSQHIYQAIIMLLGKMM